MCEIGKVVKIKANSFITDTGREFEMPMDLEDVTVEELNEWLAYFICKMQEGEK